jgi:hypothetical protein
LNAYSNPDACRLAEILRELCWAANIDAIPRNHVVARWTVLHPRHVTQTSRRSIHSRVTRGLSLLKTAGIAEGQDGQIVLLNSDRLLLSAGNLSIVQDDQGIAIRPGLWTRRPSVPSHLQAISDKLEESRQASIASTDSEE